jgi:DNA-binding NarL/FixJ family response regulator
MASPQLESTQHAERGDFALSTEERRLIALVAAGYSNKEMARHFALSESTIYRRAVRILGKLGAANRFELVLVAIFYGISADA